jgi:hypothetical protein
VSNNYITQGGQTNGIWAEIECWCEEGTDEWTSVCIIYKGKQKIAGINEGDDYITIRGTFDEKESEKHDAEGVPEGIYDEAIFLTIEDIQRIAKILKSWIDEEDLENSKLWEEVP